MINCVLRGLAQWGGILAIGIWLAGAEGFAAEGNAVSALTPAADEKGQPDVASVAHGPADPVAADAPPADSSFYQPGTAGEGISYWALMAKLGLGLGLVVCLAWGAMWVLRRTSVGQHMVANGGAVRVLERTFLAPKKAIYLVDIGGRTLALGVTDDHITSLAEWDAGELSLAPPPPAQDLSSAFKNLLGQMRKQPAEEALK